MKNSLYNKKHIREYLLYGVIAALLYIIPSWIFFALSRYEDLWLVFFGSILFMFVIMQYVWKLSKRRPEYKSSWMMIIAAHFAIFVGVIFSVLLTVLLCFAYIPGFLSGDSPSVIDNAPAGFDQNNSSTVMLLFVCATIENIGVASFIAVLTPYVFKRNQTKDKTALLEPHINFKGSNAGKSQNK